MYVSESFWLCVCVDEVWGLSKEAILGLQSLTMKKRKEGSRLLRHAKNCYVQVLTGTELNLESDSEEYHSDSEVSD